MKLRKLAATVTSVVMIASLFAGCASSDKKDESKKDDSKETEATGENNGEITEDSLYVEFNGVKLSIGMDYSDVEDKLGDKSKPDENVMPCTGEDIPIEVIHFYEGLTIDATNDGKIAGISVNPFDGGVGDGALLGVINQGYDMASVSDVLGEESDGNMDEGWLQYSFGDTTVMINSFMDDTTKVESVSIYNMSMIYG